MAPFGNRLGSQLRVIGFRDRPKINFTTAVAEGKTRRHVSLVPRDKLNKTPASHAVWMLFSNFQAFPNLLGSRAFTEAYRCVKFILSLDFLFAHCIFLKELMKRFAKLLLFDHAKSKRKSICYPILMVKISLLLNVS